MTWQRLQLLGCLWETTLIIMRFIMFSYLRTTSMKVNWKQVALYVIKVIELILTGAAGGAVSQLL